jgi:predicted amidophosphoribosyltransferase
MNPKTTSYYICPVCGQRWVNYTCARDCCELQAHYEYSCGECHKEHSSEEMARICCDGEAMLSLLKDLEKAEDAILLKKIAVHNMVICLKEEQNA